MAAGLWFGSHTQKMRSVYLCVLLSLMVITSAAPISPALAYVTIDPIPGEISISTSSTGSGSGPDMGEAVSGVIDRYKAVAVALTGVCAITSIIFFLFNIMGLGAAGDNERARAKAIKGILVSGACLAIFGGLTVFVSFFWNVFAS